MDLTVSHINKGNAHGTQGERSNPANSQHSILLIISNFQGASPNQCKLLDFFMISVTLLACSHGILQAFEHLF